MRHVTDHKDCWYVPDKSKHCLYHTKGYEMYEAARAHGGASELGRLYLSCGQEPSKKLKLEREVGLKKEATSSVPIHY